MHPDFSNHPKVLVALAIAFPLTLAFSLCFLSAMFRREAVKRELAHRGCAPLRIWWMPVSWYGGYWSTCFHVRCRDGDNLLHKAICCVYVDLMDNPFIGERRVRWYRDKIKGEG